MKIISQENFENIMKDKALFLPMNWDGKNFIETLNSTFEFYIKKVDNEFDEKSIKKFLKFECELLIKIIECNLNGFTTESFLLLDKLMRRLMKFPLKVYLQTSTSRFTNLYVRRDVLELYRVAKINENENISLNRIFHVPYNMRNKISTNRYSIAGHPCLYLGSTLELCCNELRCDLKKDKLIASKVRLSSDSEVNIHILEFGIKPQDFFRDSSTFNPYINPKLLFSQNYKTNYIMWYPLILTCSFIRNDRSSYYAVEYIVPQLVMQWLRKINTLKGYRNKEYLAFSSSESYPYSFKTRAKKHLWGIRYFSCISGDCSEWGLNYVFPTSGESISPELQYCPILSSCFSLTYPKKNWEYLSFETFKKDLIKDDFLYKIKKFATNKLK